MSVAFWYCFATKWLRPLLESRKVSKPHTHACSVARFLNLFGDAWTWLVVREAFYGATRFTEFQRNTGIARNLLSERLRKLVDAGILDREDVGERGTRYAYRLTEKGRALLPVLVAMVQWSNRELYGAGAEPVLLVDRATGLELADLAPRAADGEALAWGSVAAQPGPGADRAARERIAAAHSSALGLEAGD